MNKEIFDKASDLNKRIEFYSRLEKFINASGVDAILHPDILKEYGKDFVQILKDDLLPSVEQRLQQSKQEFESL